MDGDNRKDWNGSLGKEYMSIFLHYFCNFSKCLKLFWNKNKILEEKAVALAAGFQRPGPPAQFRMQAHGVLRVAALGGPGQGGWRGRGSRSRDAAWAQNPGGQVGRHTHAHCPDHTPSAPSLLYPLPLYPESPLWTPALLGSLSGAQAQGSGQFSLDLIPSSWGLPGRLQAWFWLPRPFPREECYLWPGRGRGGTHVI